MNRFVLKAPYSPSGDQPQAIEALARGFEQGMQSQVLLGVTGSGKTFTIDRKSTRLNSSHFLLSRMPSSA